MFIMFANNHIDSIQEEGVQYIIRMYYKGGWGHISNQIMTKIKIP